MTKRNVPAMPDQADYSAVHGDIVALLEAARRAAARSVNALMTASYWEIGGRIVEFEQGGQERTARGQQLLQRLSNDLGQRFGRGFSVDNLEQMRLFYRAYPPQSISETLSRNKQEQTVTGKSETVSRNITLEQLAQALPLSWSHYFHLVRRARSAKERGYYHCNYARQLWALPGENPPVGLILRARAKSVRARCALNGLPNKVMAAEYKTVLPDVELLQAELEKTRRELDARRIGRDGDAGGNE